MCVYHFNDVFNNVIREREREKLFGVQYLQQL